MQHLTPNPSHPEVSKCRIWSARAILLAVMTGLILSGCAGTITPWGDGRVYHCVAMEKPIPPANTFAERWPLSSFEYGNYKWSEGFVSGYYGHCNDLQLPKTAYIRYQYRGVWLEKTFDLSALAPGDVYKRHIVFFVEGETVEVRLEGSKGIWPRQWRIIDRR